MHDLEKLTRQFLEAFATTETLLAAFGEQLAEGIDWHNIGLSRTTGRDQAISALTAMLGPNVRGFDVELQHVARSGQTVLTERHERLVNQDGSIVFEAQVAAGFDFDAAGLIVAWREYQDTVPFAVPAGPR